MSKHKHDLAKLKAIKKFDHDTQASTEYCSCCVCPAPLTYDLFFSGNEDAGGEGGVGEQAVQIRRQVA